MPKYNHQLWIAFDVESNHISGEDITPKQIRDAIERRMADLDDIEIMEAALPPGDTYAIEEAA